MYIFVTLYNKQIDLDSRFVHETLYLIYETVV